MKKRVREEERSKLISKNLEDLRCGHSDDTPMFLDALQFCAKHRVVMPEWLAELIQEGYERVVSGKARTLHEAYGPIFRRGLDYQNHISQRKNNARFYVAAMELARISGDFAVSDSFFDEVADEMGDSLNAVKSAYESAINGPNPCLTLPQARELWNQYGFDSFRTVLEDGDDCDLAGPIYEVRVDDLMNYRLVRELRGQPTRKVQSFPID